MKGIFVGNDFQAGAITIKCDAPCLGVSFKLGSTSPTTCSRRFPATLSIALGGAVIFLTVGVSSGIFAARRRGTLADKGIVGVSLVINAIPYYLLALLAYLLLISKWGIFPESGYHSCSPRARSPGSRACSWPGWWSASPPPRSTPGSAAARWSSR